MTTESRHRMLGVAATTSLCWAMLATTAPHEAVAQTIRVGRVTYYNGYTTGYGGYAPNYGSHGYGWGGVGPGYSGYGHGPYGYGGQSPYALPYTRSYGYGTSGGFYFGTGTVRGFHRPVYTPGAGRYYSPYGYRGY